MTHEDLMDMLHEARIRLGKLPDSNWVKEDGKILIMEMQQAHELIEELWEVDPWGAKEFSSGLMKIYQRLLDSNIERHERGNGAV